MKSRTILASLAAFFAVVALGFAADPNMGTWKLNEGKSKFSAGATKNHTVVYAPAGDMVKVTVDGTDKDGKAVHNVSTGKFDGKDYPVSGEQASRLALLHQGRRPQHEHDPEEGRRGRGFGQIAVRPMASPAPSRRWRPTRR